MMTFAYPWALFLFAVILLAYFYLLYWKKRPSFQVPSTLEFAKVGAKKRKIPLAECLYLIAGALLVVAIARPRQGEDKVMVRSQGIDIILAIDLSGSMSAIDVPSGITTAGELRDAIQKGTVKNRLETAKDQLKKFVDGRPNDRIGLIGFGPMAYNAAPPTLDHSWLIFNLDQFKPGILGDATGIAAPLASGVHRLKSSAAPRRVIVLFTDGKNNIDNRITPEQVAELAKEANVIIHTVGIGSANAVMEENGRFYPMPDNFDEPLLRKIAEVSGGSYFQAADTDGFAKVMQEINQLEKTSFEQPKYIEYREFAPLFAGLALLFLLLGFIYDHTRGLSLP